MDGSEYLDDVARSTDFVFDEERHSVEPHDGYVETRRAESSFDDGDLPITGRKKEININAAGKNVSPARVEGTVKAQSPPIASVLVVGDERPFVTALIALDLDAVTQLALQCGWSGESPAALVASDAVLAAVAEAVGRA